MPAHPHINVISILLVIIITMRHATGRSRKPCSPGEQQRQRMERTEAKQHAKEAMRGKLYRQKRLDELKLGIETRPIETSGLLDYVSAVS